MVLLHIFINRTMLKSPETSFFLILLRAQAKMHPESSNKSPCEASPVGAAPLCCSS